jgi:hypothetical protein
MTAKDFKDPLLKALLFLTQGTGIGIAMEKVCVKVCELMGIELDQYGLNEASGKPQVEKWVQWAFKELVTEGYANRLAKGQWTLTTAGLTEANRLASISVPISVPPSPLQENSTDTDGESYHSDPYIRELARENTQCFGFLAEQSPVCRKCCFAVSCLAKRQNNMEALSQELLAKDKEKDNPKPKKPVTRTLVEDENHRTITCVQSVQCPVCKQMVAKGEQGYWVRPAEPSGQAEIFHLPCYLTGKPKA